jgi:hypothetical protein
MYGTYVVSHCKTFAIFRFNFGHYFNSKSWPGMPDFSWCMIPKLEKCTKWTQNVPNGHKISQISKKVRMAIKFINILNSRPRKFFQNWDFWFENKQSGNPGPGLFFCIRLSESMFKLVKLDLHSVCHVMK